MKYISQYNITISWNVVNLCSIRDITDCDFIVELHFL